ncbi:hypothetical protein SALBM135S_06617 [Streptomyces alboniger]
MVGKQDLDSADPQRAYYGMSWDFMRFYTRQLVTYDTKPGKAGTKLVPDLATSTAKISDDGKTYTYKLRDGLTWEDGSKLTSKDIKYGIERVWATDTITGGPGYIKQTLDPKGKYKGPYKDSSKEGLDAIETPDDQTIIFKLPKRNGDFEQFLAMPTGSPVKAEKDTKAKYTQRPFSAGPYKFQTYKAGQEDRPRPQRQVEEVLGPDPRGAARQDRRDDLRQPGGEQQEADGGRLRPRHERHGHDPVRSCHGRVGPP